MQQLNKVFFKLFGSMSKECYTEISYYFGIGPTEEIVRKRRDKFINSYDVSDASVSCYIPQMLTVSICFRSAFNVLYCFFLNSALPYGEIKLCNTSKMYRIHFSLLS